jgi:hypothetical protein
MLFVKLDASSLKKKCSSRTSKDTTHHIRRSAKGSQVVISPSTPSFKRCTLLDNWKVRKNVTEHKSRLAGSSSVTHFIISGQTLWYCLAFLNNSAADLVYTQEMPKMEN